MEREDAEAIAEHPLLKCDCAHCIYSAGRLAGEVLAVRERRPDIRTDVVVAGALAGALATLIAHPGSTARSREQLKRTFSRLAYEAFDRFVDDILAEQQEADALRKGMH